MGRSFEVKETRRLLSESRLVTLTGLGGVGKTRLALRVARDAQRTFVDGTWFVDLSELHDADQLAQAVASTLGLQDWSVRSPQSVLIDHLADRRTLLLLDNCEHLVGPVAALVQTLLRACLGLSVLATSREPLGIGGDAVALFEQRARAVVPGFRLTTENSATVARICARLGGLPLPIELAAARLRAQSVDQLLERLDDRLRLLTRGDRTTPSRQQTLRLCIDWSYGLCTDREQRLWARLSVFAGSVALDAIEGVVADDGVDGDLLDVVTSLADKSILIREEVDAAVRSASPGASKNSRGPLARNGPSGPRCYWARPTPCSRRPAARRQPSRPWSPNTTRACGRRVRRSGTRYSMQHSSEEWP
ncbi:putative ATPase [Rhodococcus sp. BE178]